MLQIALFYEQVIVNFGLDIRQNADLIQAIFRIQKTLLDSQNMVF